MTRQEKLDLFFERLQDKSFAYQAGYFEAVLRTVMPDDYLDMVCKTYIKDQMKLDLEGESNVAHN